MKIPSLRILASVLGITSLGIVSSGATCETLPKGIEGDVNRQIKAGEYGKALSNLDKMERFAPVVDILTGGAKKRLFISPRTLGQGIEPAVKKQGGKFTGLKLRLKKESADQMAPYVVEML